MGKFVLIIIVWVVAICLFTGILLTGMVAWFKHGGHPDHPGPDHRRRGADRLGHHRGPQGERAPTEPRGARSIVKGGTR